MLQSEFPRHTKLPKAELIGCLGRSDDESTHRADITVAAGHGDGEVVAGMRVGDLARDSRDRSVRVGVGHAGGVGALVMGWCGMTGV